MSTLGKPREIVTPRVVQVIIQEDGREQAEQGASGVEVARRSARARDFVGADEVEVELIGVSFGEEVATAGERFQIEKRSLHRTGY
jgi:hypothetical protein